MQLYVLNPNPRECARVLYRLSPKRAMGQLKEGMQMLAAHADYQPPKKKDGSPYSRYWGRHPVTKWIVSSPDNFGWTVDFLKALATECFPGTAWESSLVRWLGEESPPSWQKLPEFQYFGTWEVEGGSVYEKYQNYINDKLGG